MRRHSVVTLTIICLCLSLKWLWTAEGDQVMVVTGGYTPNGRALLDLWLYFLSNDTWVDPHPNGTSPSFRTATSNVVGGTKLVVAYNMSAFVYGRLLFWGKSLAAQ